MQKTGNSQRSSAIHRKIKSSTVKSRKSLQQTEASSTAKIEKKRRSIIVIDRNVVEDVAKDVIKEQPQEIEQATITMPEADMSRVNERMRARSETQQQTQLKLSAKEIKEQAIQRALNTAERTVDRPAAKQKKKKQPIKLHFSFGRLVLAFSCAAAVMFAVIYFVNLNQPDISLKVAAMQTGIDASYPSYVPRDFSLSDVTSGSGEVTLKFRNAKTNESFSLIEKRSVWDSNALLEKFVKIEYSDNYTVLKENGLTIYVDGGDAAWVNGGIFYRLVAEDGVLTKKQIRTLAASV